MPAVMAVGAAIPAAGAVTLHPAAVGYIRSADVYARRWSSRKRPVKFDPLKRLPDQLVEQVISYLPMTALAKLMAVARHYRALIPPFVIDLKCLAHHVPQVRMPSPSSN